MQTLKGGEVNYNSKGGFQQETSNLTADGE